MDGSGFSLGLGKIRAGKGGEGKERKKDSNAPLLFFKPSANNSGRSSGSWIVSRMSLFTLARPPTSSQVTFGILGAPMLSE
jgi:hypothetical protein